MPYGRNLESKKSRLIENTRFGNCFLILQLLSMVRTHAGIEFSKVTFLQVGESCPTKLLNLNSANARFFPKFLSFEPGDDIPREWASQSEGGEEGGPVGLDVGESASIEWPNILHWETLQTGELVVARLICATSWRDFQVATREDFLFLFRHFVVIRGGEMNLAPPVARLSSRDVGGCSFWALFVIRSGEINLALRSHKIMFIGSRGKLMGE
jgi:hypothetical protein